jgi:hypothetical protein
MSAGPSLGTNPPTGVRSDGRRAEVLTWDGQVWNAAGPLEFRQSPDRIETLTMVDVTGDGVDDVIASMWLGQDVYGDVFVFDGGRYRVVEVDNSANPMLAPGEIPNPQLAGGSLTGFAETCEPSCATGGLLTVTYAWAGDRLRSSAGVCSDYRAVPEYTDMAVCTKGGTIAQLQEALIYFGYMRGPADGYFGPGTRAGVVAYQREVGMFESGWITISDAIALIEYYHQSESGDW